MFDIYGFNFAIVGGLFVGFFGGLLGRWRSMLAAIMGGLGVFAAQDVQGRPDAEVLQAVQGHTLLRTDRNGWNELGTDGERMWVEVGRRSSPCSCGKTNNGLLG